jgi:cation transport regulator ChaC
MTTLHLTLLGAVRELTAAELPAVVSVHNGRSLRRFALELHVPDERHEELDAELQAASTADGPHIQGTDATWRVSEGWTAVSQGRRPEICIYKAEIQEVEELRVSALEIEGLSLVPTRYREGLSEETITATFVTEVSDEDDERLEELLRKPHEFFDVIRRGISDEPLRMRFGRRVWQRAGEGARRHNLVLIADEDTSQAAPDPLALVNQPQLDRTMEKACANTNALALLLEELRSKGVLDKDAFHAIKHAATAHPLTHEEKRELSRTDRLDDYWR